MTLANHINKKAKENKRINSWGVNRADFQHVQFHMDIYKPKLAEAVGGKYICLFNIMWHASP